MVAKHMAIDEQKLKEIAREIRKDIVTMVHLAGDGHPGPALSITDLVTALYFQIMKINPKKPNWPDRDRLILSKGHACPAIYSTLARLGLFSREILPSLRSLGSILQGHPDMKKTPGIDMTTGSLGHGLSIGAGMAMAARLSGSHYYLYVIMGDGELNEGIVWEAATTAVHYQLGHLIAFIDNNGYQSGGTLEEVSGMGAILPRFEIAGWHCQEIDGHNFSQIIGAVEEAKRMPDRPSVIVARTIKGKGVPFMENDNSWHKRVPTREQMEAAMKILEEPVL
jgi:transketolase